MARSYLEDTHKKEPQLMEEANHDSLVVCFSPACRGSRRGRFVPNRLSSLTQVQLKRGLSGS